MSAARVAVACLLIASCSRNGTATSDLPQGDDPVELDPADFGVDITHPYWPMQPGARWRTKRSTRTARRCGSS